MKYYKTTIYTPPDLTNTQVVYLEASDPGELLIVAMDTHSKPVIEYEEVTKDVYDANQ